MYVSYSILGGKNNESKAFTVIREMARRLTPRGESYQVRQRVVLYSSKR